MLQFESDDFLEINPADILAIQRSRAPVSITVASGRSFDLRATLCQQLVNKQPVCYLVLYSSSLKRALVFSFDGATDAASQICLGVESLAGFGFQLDPLDLNLKPAMLETVLRDIPPMQKPEYVRRMRKERQSRIASLEKTLKMLGKPAPSSKEGLEHKKTLEQLNAERKAEQHLQSLREHFQKELSVLEEKLKLLSAAQVPPETKEQFRPQPSKDERPSGGSTPAFQAPGNEATKSKHRQAQPEPEPAANQLRQAIETEKPADRSAGEEKRKFREILPEKVQKQPDDETQHEVAAKVATHQAASPSRKDLSAEPAVGKSERSERETQLQQAEQQARKDLAEVSKELDSVRKDLAEVSKELDSTRKDLTESRQGLEKSDKELAETRKQLVGAQKELGGLQKQIAVRDGEVTELKAETDRLTAQHKTAEQHGKAEEKKRRALEGELKDIRAEISEVEQGNQLLTEQLVRVRQDVEQARGEKESLAKDASRSAARLKKLEAELPLLRTEAEAAAAANSEAEQLRARLEQLRGRYEALTKENALLVEESTVAREQLATHGLQEQSSPQKDDVDGMAREQASARMVAALQKQLAAAERRLKDSVGEREELGAAYAQEQQKSRNLEEELERLNSVERVVAPANAKPVGAKKPPHEQRRPPLPGAFFHVDWDLNGLTCEIGMVGQAWQSIYNVTLSIEGYSHQYVEAVIVLLKETAKSRLFMMFRLEGEGRNLVYRPAKLPDSDAALKKSLEEARNYLRVSGIEVEPVPADQLKKVLSPYLIQA
jgi:hypothetical protein